LGQLLRFVVGEHGRRRLYQRCRHGKSDTFSSTTHIVRRKSVWADSLYKV